MATFQRVMTLKTLGVSQLVYSAQILRTLRKQNLINFSRVVEKEKIKKRAGLYRDLEKYRLVK